MDTKTCKLCGEEKPLEQFPKHSARKDGLDNRCKPCMAKYKAHLFQLHQRAPEKPDVCPFCKVNPGNGKKGWHLDHDHLTGEIRGWLCAVCNHNIEWYIKYMDAINKYLGNETTNRC